MLFRTFARTGIYLFNEDSPLWAFRAYTAVVWFGNTMFNFAAILSLIVLAVLAIVLWMRRDISGRALPIGAALFVPWNVALVFGTPSPMLELAYIGASVLLIGLAMSVALKSASTGVRITSVLLGASFLCVYYFETIAPLRNSGISFADNGLLIFRVGEALAGVAIVASFLTWGKTRSVKVILFPALLGILMAGSYLTVPDRFPLITTWALGITMSMPNLLYSLGVALLGITLLNLVKSGKVLLASSLVLVYFSHRMLPLTYFNVLILIGFLLIAVAVSTSGASGTASLVKEFAEEDGR